MPKYFFSVLDRDGASPAEKAYEFDNDSQAVEEGRKALAEMALDGLPGEPLNMIAVEVFDEIRRPIVEIRLTLEFIPKNGGRPTII
ncbi:MULTISPECIES: DUF6894 family protein [unclassified Rhizobium]|jgi:hypothetical protein|uniref:DUF6894 family protein n=1 Tax=unclassified Rhizobium TaxID=2613769 RepID=UPI0016007848|nr:MULTISPECIES: hypothetical protein [unclassified Rhizobium]MBB1248840.1 hypothetical protein [Rhizobium sp. G21]MCV3766755.1 hypothetical protein [Rhizobium sp. TRM95796]